MGDAVTATRGDPAAKEQPAVGVVVVGHGETASALLAAARAIVGVAGGDPLGDVVAIDAGVGQSPEFQATLCQRISAVDRGRGVLLLVDLLGASPATCCLREASGHAFALVSGLSLAVLLKLATLDRRALGPEALAAACAASGQRAVTIRGKIAGDRGSAAVTDGGIPARSPREEEERDDEPTHDP